MKNLSLTSLKRLPLNMLLIASLSLVFVSCSKEEMNDSQLSAELTAEAAAKANNAAPAPSDYSIAEVATYEGFTRLLEALIYVDSNLGTQYVQLFSEGTDQYTVFAPNDEAFEAAYAVLGTSPQENIDPELLETVLLYHVVEGRRAANSVVPPKNPREIETLLGVPFYVDKYGTIQAVGNTAGIVAANFSASNGIVHEIDAVLLPIEL